MSRLAALVSHTDTTYLDYVLFVDVLVAGLQLKMRWDELVKPWFDAWPPTTRSSATSVR